MQSKYHDRLSAEDLFHRDVVENSLNLVISIKYGKSMKFISYTAISIVISLILIGFLSNRESTSLVEGGISANPCQSPLTFSVGEIDDRFGVTESEVRSAIINVAEVWSDAAGTPVATFSEDGEIKVHLIYDEQQQLTDRERQFRNRLQMREYQISAFENDYQASVQRFEERNEEYQRESERVQQAMTQLNDWIQQINSQGGFNSEQLELLKERRERIDRMSERMEQSGAVITEKVDEINVQLRQLNRMVEEKNELIQEYNRTFSGTRRFTQGSYERSGDRRWISVFQFANSEEMELVIAHEVGHALGLDHVDNPASVMHQLMGQQVRTELVLTDEDRDALRDACGF